MAVEQQTVTTQEPDTILLEPQLTPGQNLFVPQEGEERGTFYGLQEQDGVTVYASLKIIGSLFRLHLILWNTGTKAIEWHRQNVTLANQRGDPIPLRLVRKGFLDGRVRPEETAGGKMYFQAASSSQTPAILTLSVGDKEFRFRFDVLSPETSAITPQQRGFEVWQKTQAPLPRAPYRNPNCLCLECVGRLWSPHCDVPYNQMRPHEGLCPYCGSPISSAPVEKEWFPYWDSLYNVMGFANVRWCDNCKYLL